MKIFYYLQAVVQVNISTYRYKRLFGPLSLSVLLIFILVLRLVFLPVTAPDYVQFIDPWYRFIKMHGILHAFSYNFSNYAPAYLYLLAVATLLPLPELLAIKAVSLFFDNMLVLCIYLLFTASEDSYNKVKASTVACGVLLVPSICINSALWAQCDAIYISFCLLSLYFLLKRRGKLSCVALGLGFAFKLQALFFFPVLLLAVFKKKLNALYLLFIPAMYLLSLIPCLLAGRPLVGLLTIYLQQTNTYHKLSMAAPNFWLWVSNTYFVQGNLAGLLITALLCITLLSGFTIYTNDLSQKLLLKITLMFVLCVPFFLPQMHERYFYLAECIAYLCCCLSLKFLPVFLLLELAMVGVYVSFILPLPTLTLQLLPLFSFTAILLILADLVNELRLHADRSTNQNKPPGLDVC